MSFSEEKLLMLFGNTAGNGVEEYSIQINLPVISKDICVGDHLHFGDSVYEVTAIGEEAMETLRLLGHCTLRFDGSIHPTLPGSIYLEDKEMPVVEIGGIIYFD